MRIVLAEEVGDRRLAERSFEGATIKVGRDETKCQLVFDSDDWSMVSRQHAELVIQQNRCLIADLSSRFGTFVDNRRIDQPTPIRAGTRIQFGESGPVVVIISIEPGSPAEKDSGNQDKTVPMNISSEAHGKDRLVNTSPGSLIELLDKDLRTVRRFPLNKGVVRMGREGGMDVEIDADAAVVSRRHAELRRLDGQYEIVDLNSFNGTLVNDQRITSSVLLYDGDRIELGPGGPVLRFVDPRYPPPPDGGLGARSTLMAHHDGRPHQQLPPVSGPLADIAVQTIVASSGKSALPQERTTPVDAGQSQFLIHRPFGDRRQLSIGRADSNDIRLDGLLISNHHARLSISTNGLIVEDLNSTNGVFVNGGRVVGSQPLKGYDIVKVGPFLLQADIARGVAVFDTRSKTRIDAINITKEVRDRSGQGTIKLLDQVSLTIQPNEFVGLLGPSGAGKSTLMDSLNGMRPATSGQVLINSLELYQHLESLKQSIGYVPQDDIIHRELTVQRTLYYVARLRLSKDVSEQEVEQIVGEVLDVTGLSERRHVPVSQLSGGQRKRVSIAVELITKPSVIFLDEPTSGLDPATEDKIMKLFRQIAESGRTVILTTHAMENVRLFDKVVVLMRGKLVFYGTPQEALSHTGAASFKELYDKLEGPIQKRLAPQPVAQSNGSKERIAEDVAEDWKKRFTQTPAYEKNVERPAREIKITYSPASPIKQVPAKTAAMRQWGTLARRYMEVLSRDRLNLLILVLQAPLIAVLTALVVGWNASRDFPFFVLALVAIWFGTSVSAREIIRERAIYNRERMVNLGLLPYVGSKLLVLLAIVGVQCLLLLGTLKLLAAFDLTSLPGIYFGLPQLGVMILTGAVGIALGLFVSAIVKTSEMATSLVPLILIPQILFSGLVGIPSGFSKVVGVTMPATWSFDELKRLSDLPVLRGKAEGAQPAEGNEGRGLYKQIEYENDQNIAETQKRIEQYKVNSESRFREFETDLKEHQEALLKGQAREKPSPPKLGPAPSAGEAKKVPENLSGYIDFLHPWGGKWRDPAVLLLMFMVFVFATTQALRKQDSY